MNVFKRILPIAIIVSLYWSYTLYCNYQLRKYGLDYNVTRKQIGLPLLEENWQENLSSDEISFINPRHTGARHARKTITSASGGLTKEADLFFLPQNKGTLDIIFQQNISHSKAKLYLDSVKKPITISYTQALDTLRKYRLFK